jgi:hypothetical protein
MRILLARSVCAVTHARAEPRRRFRASPCLIVAAVAVAGIFPRSVVIAETPDNPACVCTNCKCATARSRGQCAAQFGNFEVRSFLGGPAADDVARHCDQVYSQLCHNVFDLDPTTHWQPKCRVVLHATRQAYANSVGRGAAQTVGSSTVSLSGGRVTERRIDLLAANAEQGLSALPHEMIHILFVDAFPTSAPPKWAEEGLALTMDSSDKKSRHARDLNAAIQASSTLPIARLLSDVEYPAASQRATFYAQSLSLVEYFTQQDTPKEFIRYLRLSAQLGQDRALLAVYDLDGPELNRRWWAHATGIRLASTEAP